MTDVKKGRSRLINSETEARALFKTAPAGVNGKIGLEVEMPLYRPGRTKPATPTAAEILLIRDDLKARGYDPQMEASGVIEYASDPVALGDVAALVATAHKSIAAFEDAIAARGVVRAPFCIVPTTTLREAFNNHGARERLDASLQALKAHNPAALNTPLLTTSVQTNFSPKSDAELFRMTCRGYALTPLLIAAMGSSSGYAENRRESRAGVHLRSLYYAAFGSASGIPRSFLTSTDAESFIRGHVAEVFDTPMFFAYAADGTLVRAPKGETLTFRKLTGKGLNTQSNYELAETFRYTDIKIANIRNGDGEALGKRVEVRAADSGPHQPFSTLLLTAALIPDGPTADRFDALLRDYGFSGTPAQDAALLLAARKAAVEHGGRFMDVPFGTGNLRDFAADVAGLVSAHYAHDKTVAPDVAKLAGILLTGESDARRHAAAYKSLRDVTRALQSAPAPPLPQQKAV
ncbi:MAG: hypothetical protein KGL10_03645 [Alphaproteobacteria bacterium]|nr:hypothetical protein [Alphaproteobacteria bacterium]MDE2336384.1 hypothetical protein [Alphaproteobacteria bacterium]